MTNAKNTLTATQKAFLKYPSATNWRALEAAMLEYQAAHQAALIAKSYAKFLNNV
jgi:hypothetical protein